MTPNKSEMEAIALTTPAYRPVFNPQTLQEDMHLSYDAEVQYKRKDPQTRLILCSKLDNVSVGEPVMISYHQGMRAYKHSRTVTLSSKHNSFGGFYFPNGTPA